MVECVIRMLKEICVHRDRCDSQQNAMKVIGDWIGFYNNRRPQQAFGMKMPAQEYQLAARLGHIQLGRYMSTISREISHNSSLRGYRPKQACFLAENRTLDSRNARLIGDSEVALN